MANEQHSTRDDNATGGAAAKQRLNWARPRSCDAVYVHDTMVEGNFCDLRGGRILR